MNKFKQWIDRLWRVLKISVNRFPETLLISLTLVVVLILDNHMDFDSEQLLVKLALVLSLGIPISAMITLTIERLNLNYFYRIGLALGVIVYCGVFYYLIPEEIGQRFMIRYAIVTAIAYFLFTLVPYVWKREKYGLYCVKLLVSFFVTYLYTLVLFLGVIAIIFAVDFLFELDISEKIYFDTFIAAVGLFGLTYFLGKVPNIDDELGDYNYPSVLRVLLVSIIVPLISVYTLVLHAYLIRVLVSIGWSDGFVSQLVIWYGFVSVILMVLLYPLIEDSKIVKAFYKYYPYAMIIPLIMLAITMTIRINAYGFTILRALVFVAWLWFVLSVAHVIVKKGRISQNLVVGFILLFGLAVFSPVNVFTASDSAQTKRLSNLLESSGILEDDTLVPQGSLDEASRILISDLIGYLDESGGLEEVAYLPEGFNTNDMKEVFGFDYISDRYYVDEFGQTYVNYFNETPLLTDITGYDYHMKVSSRYDEEDQRTDDGLMVMDQDGTVIVQLDGQVLYETSIEALLMDQDLPVGYTEGTDPMMVEVDGDWGSMKMVFNDINGQMNDDVLEVTYYSADVFITLK